jgi:hypothetical protein
MAEAVVTGGPDDRFSRIKTGGQASRLQSRLMDNFCHTLGAEYPGELREATAAVANGHATPPPTRPTKAAGLFRSATAWIAAGAPHPWRLEGGSLLAPVVEPPSIPAGRPSSYGRATCPLLRIIRA